MISFVKQTAGQSGRRFAVGLAKNLSLSKRDALR
jgi:hypothetical protein